jgi:hypothetical protein
LWCTDEGKYIYCRLSNILGSFSITAVKAYGGISISYILDKPFSDDITTDEIKVDVSCIGECGAEYASLSWFAVKDDPGDIRDRNFNDMEGMGPIGYEHLWTADYTDGMATIPLNGNFCVCMMFTPIRWNDQTASDGIFFWDAHTTDEASRMRLAPVPAEGTASKTICVGHGDTNVCPTGRNGGVDGDPHFGK